MYSCFLLWHIYEYLSIEIHIYYIRIKQQGKGGLTVADVFDYLAWRGDVGFDAVAANEGDRLILCMLSFVDFEGIVSDEIGRNEIALSEAVQIILAKKGKLTEGKMRRLVLELAQSRRFGSILLSGYRTRLSKGEDPRSQLQFAALTVRFSSHLSVIYRGTDDTLVGWKENFNSDLMYPIPAQEMAASYLTQASVSGLPIAVQGHSKGGNLAVYAATVSSIPEQQLMLVYDYDGPGFDRSFFEKDRYQRIRHKIQKFLPEYPVIGLIRESDCKKTVVHCTGKGLSQHNGFHWQYCSSGLSKASRADPGAILLNSRLKRFYGALNLEERKQFIEGAYRLASYGGRETVSQLTNSKRQLFRDFKQLGQSEKQNLMLVLSQLFRQMIYDGEKQKNS